MTAHELGLWDRLEREACLLEAYALTPLYLTEYLRAETGYEVAGLSGLLPGLIQGLKVLAATTVAGAAAGAAAGTPFFGVGAVPGAIFGAEAGLDAGLYLLFLAGLPALAEYVAANIGRVVALFQQGTGIAWNAPDSPLVQAEVERAARCFAQGVAIWVRIVLEAVVLYLIGKGAAGAARRLAREMHAAGYGALAETVEAEGTSLVGNPKLQPKMAGAAESGGGDTELDAPQPKAPQPRSAVKASPKPVRLKHKCTSGAVLEAEPGRTTTILGRYKDDMKGIIEELGVDKSLDFGPNPGGFNVLNAPIAKGLRPRNLWDGYNQPWLEQAIARNDKFVFATEPQGDALSNPFTNEMTGLGREFKYLQMKGYRYDPVTHTMER
jgi:hypothetical protein